MAGYDTADLRNVVLAGHSGAGKTLLVESLLLASGALHTKGDPARGTLACDFDPQERAHGHSISCAVTFADHQGCRVNLIDTPGHPDLFGRALCAFPAADSLLLVVNAQTGVESVTRRALQAALQRRLCCMLIVNQIDAEEADPVRVIGELQDAFGTHCLPVNLPSPDGQTVIDCMFSRSGPQTAFGSVEEAHQAIIERIIEEDDSLLEAYLEQDEEPSIEQLTAPFRKALREGHLVPICFASAERDVGVRKLLEVICRLMPHPGEANMPAFVRHDGDQRVPVEVVPDPARHAVAHVFKVTVDPYVGRLGIFRIYQGTVRTGSQLYVGTARKPFQVAHLYQVNCKETVEVPAGIPGDICAVAKVDEIEYNAVLHDSRDEADYELEPVALPAAIVGVTVAPARRGDEQKLSDTLSKLLAEDPSLRLAHDKVANETVLYAVGELHQRVALERMQEHYHTQVVTGTPSVPFRETITIAAEGHYRHKKQTGGAGQFGEVFLRVEPLPRGGGFEFVDEVVGGAIPSQFIPAVEKGVRQVLEGGALAGYPLEDVRVTVYDGKHHAVDSKEVAFIAAGRHAFLDAIQGARPVLLEPIADIRVTAPAQNIGNVTGELTSMRARILNQNVDADGRIVLEAQVPLAEMNGFHSRLKSFTAGEGGYEIELSHYEPAPDRLQQHVIADYQERRKTS